MVRFLVWPILASALLGLPSAGLAQPRSSDAALVYTLEADRTIYWQPIGSAQRRALYTLADTWTVGYMPNRGGYLPSPDGRWLLVWETPMSQEGRAAERSRWRVLSIPDGTVQEIGETEGEAWLLPYWQDSRHILLEGDTPLGGDVEITCFDVETKQLTRPLPWRRPTTVPVPYIDVLRLTTYAYRHHLVSLECLGRLTSWGESFVRRCTDIDRLGSQADRATDMVLRAAGIPGLGALLVGPPEHLHYPQVACHPAGSMAAYSVVREEPSEGQQQAGEAAAPRRRAACLEILAQGRDGHSSQARRLKTESWDERPGDFERLVVPPPPTSGHYLQPRYGDLRWSRNGRYLSYTLYGVRPRAVTVMERTPRWRDVITISGARNAFVVPVSREYGEDGS